MGRRECNGGGENSVSSEPLGVDFPSNALSAVFTSAALRSLVFNLDLALYTVRGHTSSLSLGTVSPDNAARTDVIGAGVIIEYDWFL